MTTKSDKREKNIINKCICMIIPIKAIKNEPQTCANVQKKKCSDKHQGKITSSIKGQTLMITLIKLDTIQ